MHVATSFSVLVFYRRRVLTLTRGIVSGDTNAWRYAGKLGVATIPAVVAVLLFGDFPEAQFESARSAAIGLLVTGAVLWTTRRTVASAQALEPSWIAALLIGCAPAVAILPGISRSGSTVAAAEFSFMLVSWRSQTPRSGPRRCCSRCRSRPWVRCSRVARWRGSRAWPRSGPSCACCAARASINFAWYAWELGALVLTLLAFA